MNYVGYKWLDEERTRRSADMLKMIPNESLESFVKRCKKLGYEACDKRNVIDRYKQMSDELIKGDLNEKRSNLSILLQNLDGDFNKASIIRNSNAFCCKEVIIFGDKGYDRRGACGMQKYENFRHVREVDDVKTILNEFDVIVGIDNVAHATPIDEYKWGPSLKTLVIFGEESIGIHDDIIKMCHDLVYIKQYGAVRSINVACASAIIFHEYSKTYFA